MALQLVATVVTGLLLLVVALAIARGIDWRSNEILTGRDEDGLDALASNPVVWVVAFLGLALGLTGVAIVAVGGFGLSAPGAVTVAVGAFGLLVLAYLVVGTYAAARDRDISPAGATLAAVLILGVLLLVAISVKLLLGL